MPARRFLRPCSRLPIFAFAVFAGTHAYGTLTNYWPVNEASGSPATTANAAGGTTGTLNNGATVVTDGTRGQVLAFDGIDDYVDAGVLNAFTTGTNFTWSFWSNATVNNANSVVVGNRYGATAGANSSPLNFIKFTPSQFEYYTDAGPQNADYVDFGTGTWIHNAVVKQGPLLFAYRNGLIQGFNTTTSGTTNAPGLFFGSDRGLEAWGGRLDDIATWNNALPSSSVAKLASGAVTPATAPLTATPPVLQTVLSDWFPGAALDGSKWVATNRGLENNAPVGYNPPSVSGGVVTLGGTTSQQFWFGSSIESVQTFNSSLESRVSVDRVSLTGTGTAYRSSLWILGDDTHYVHLSDNIGEGGWSFNIRDAGGVDNNPTGSGANMALLDVSPYTNGGLHNMEIHWEPTGVTGDANVFFYLDGLLAGGGSVTNFPGTFRVVLTGQGRAAGDTVSAVFDNLVVQQIPEPTVSVILGLAGFAFILRRRTGR